MNWNSAVKCAENALEREGMQVVTEISNRYIVARKRDLTVFAGVCTKDNDSAMNGLEYLEKAWNPTGDVRFDKIEVTPVGSGRALVKHFKGVEL